MTKKPSLVIYWADTRELLTSFERRQLSFSSTVLAVTPEEVLLEDNNLGRKIVIRGTTDPIAPQLPKAKEEGQ